MKSVVNKQKLEELVRKREKKGNTVRQLRTSHNRGACPEAAKFQSSTSILKSQVLRAGALGRPRGMGWGGMRERGSGWGTHVNPWLIHVNVWQKPLQYCKVISLQLIKINGKKNFFKVNSLVHSFACSFDKDPLHL